MFEPRNLFPIISLIFLLLAVARWVRSRGRPDRATLTWLWMAMTFGIVAAWLRLS